MPRAFTDVTPHRLRSKATRTERACCDTKHSLIHPHRSTTTDSPALEKQPRHDRFNPCLESPATHYNLTRHNSPQSIIVHTHSFHRDIHLRASACLCTHLYAHLRACLCGYTRLCSGTRPYAPHSASLRIRGLLCPIHSSWRPPPPITYLLTQWRSTMTQRFSAPAPVPMFPR